MELKDFRSVVLRLVIYGGMVYLSAELMRYDALNSPAGAKFSEQSITEIMQSIFLLFSSGIFLLAFFRNRQFAPMSLALFAFSLSSLIREQDAFLDRLLYHGSWKIFVLPLLAYTLYFLIRHRKSFFQNLINFVSTRAFGMLFYAVLTTYLFSRLLGRKIFWMAVMNERYLRDVKTTAEESIELFGYTLFLISGIEFIVFITKGKSKGVSVEMHTDKHAA